MQTRPSAQLGTSPTDRQGSPNPGSPPPVPAAPPLAVEPPLPTLPPIPTCPPVPPPVPVSGPPPAAELPPVPVPCPPAELESQDAAGKAAIARTSQAAGSDLATNRQVSIVVNLPNKRDSMIPLTEVSSRLAPRNSLRTSVRSAGGIPDSVSPIAKGFSSRKDRDLG
jgi:hypothetical protein